MAFEDTQDTSTGTAPHIDSAMPSYAVIGGSRGIGVELARQMAANPRNTVFVTVRNRASFTHLNALSNESFNKNLHVIEADVVDHKAMKTAASEVARINGGTLDILIENAARVNTPNMYRGLTDYEDDDQLDEEFIEAFRVNTLGVIHSVNAFLPLLRKGTTRKIMIVSSGAGDRDSAWKARIESFAAYGTIKAAVNMVATKHAAALESEGFIVFTIGPGYVDTSATSPVELDAFSQAKMAKMAANFHRVNPNYEHKSKPIDVAAKWLLNAIDSAGPQDTGTYWPSTKSSAT